VRRVCVLAFAMFAAIAAVALAYPPATVTVTQNSVTLGNLECNTRYEVRVREWRSGAFRDSRTYTPTTSACAVPTPTPTPSPTPTPTPSPTPTPEPPPTGGQPGPSNTGDPDLTNNTVQAGLEVRTAGAVIENVDVPYVVVHAPNVTIRNSYIGHGCSICVNNNSTGLVIEDTTIQGQDGTGVMFGEYTARRLEVTGTENGFNAGNNTTIVDSWIHDLDTSGDAHTDGIQNSNGASNVLVRHNYIDPVPTASGCTAPLIHSNGTGTNYRVEDNWLMGAGCSVALYCSRGTGLIMDVVNNRVERGVFGYFDACEDDRLSGNVDAVTGAPVGPPN
jgi:hypothetical protein